MKALDLRNLKKEEILQRVGHMDQVAGILSLQAADGLARDSRIFEVWTGSGLSFSVLADRALDIGDCHYKGISLAWKSANGEVHPAYYEPEGEGWLRSYAGGLLVTCGLDQFGYPNTDEGEELGLHGRISNRSARYVNHQVSWQGDQYVLEISGEVRQASVFGENLVLRRRITSWMGSNKIRIEDIVKNEGYEMHPLMILYHFNLGYPLLSEHAQLHVNVDNTIPRDDNAKGGLEDWMNFHQPIKNYSEQVFQHMAVAESDGKVNVELFNSDLGLGLKWTYEQKELPHLYQWKMMGQGLYVLGVEPANCGGMHGRADARMKENLTFLEPGESCHFALEIEVVEYEQ